MSALPRVRKFIAELIVFCVAIPHLAACVVVMILDKEVLKRYMDGMVRARRELEPTPEQRAARFLLDLSKIRDKAPK